MAISTTIENGVIESDSHYHVGVFSCSSVIENENGYRFQNSDFVYLFMLTDPDIKNAYFPNLQKYPKARVLFYPY